LISWKLAVRAAFGALVVLSAVVTAQIGAEPEERWWRGNLHTHTLWSDGDEFPEMIVEWYRNNGYHFLALSDHNVLSAGERWMPVKSINRRAGVDAFGKYKKRFGGGWVETRNDGDEVRLKTFDEYRTLVEERNKFLMIQAEEITGESGDGHALHMNVTNTGELLRYQMGATIRDTMTRNLAMVEESAARTGREMLLHVNHPNYKWGVTAEDLAAVVGERFFEVWNGVDNDNDPGDAGRPGTDAMWDIANTLRITKYMAAPLYGLATDDSHDYHGNKTRATAGRAWVMVKARHLSPASIVRAIRAGDFYASSGVTLDEVSFEKGTATLRVRIAPAGTETFVTRFVGTRKGNGAKTGEVFSEQKGLAATYKLRGDELYVRAVVQSSGTPAVPSDEFAYKRAWTQPVGW
jgi:hypothetical protein